MAKYNRSDYLKMFGFAFAAMAASMGIGPAICMVFAIIGFIFPPLLLVVGVFLLFWLFDTKG
jgi:hypothetical protein